MGFSSFPCAERPIVCRWSLDGLSWFAELRIWNAFAVCAGTGHVHFWGRLGRHYERVPSPSHHFHLTKTSVLCLAPAAGREIDYLIISCSCSLTGSLVADRHTDIATLQGRWAWFDSYWSPYLLVASFRRDPYPSFTTYLVDTFFLLISLYLLLSFSLISVIHTNVHTGAWPLPSRILLEREYILSCLSVAESH